MTDEEIQAFLLKKYPSMAGIKTSEPTQRPTATSKGKKQQRRRATNTATEQRRKLNYDFLKLPQIDEQRLKEAMQKERFLLRDVFSTLYYRRERGLDSREQFFSKLETVCKVFSQFKNRKGNTK